MANKEALRELQTRLAERLQAARAQADTAANWLAVECAGQGLLLPLAQAGEIFPLAPTLPVPHTQPWFVGVANLRGRLHGVVDLARFLGLARGAAAAEPSRLIAFNVALDINCAVLVDRLAGLRSAEQLREEPGDGRPRPAFAGPIYIDAAGRRWQALMLAALAGDEAFLKVAG
jgi:twitching motility protein PilI